MVPHVEMVDRGPKGHLRSMDGAKGSQTYQYMRGIDGGKGSQVGATEECKLLARIFHLLWTARCSTGLNGLDPEQIDPRG